MKQRNLKNENQLQTLVFEYEAMSQQGTVGFYEETVFIEIAEYYENQNMIDRALDVISHAIDQNNYSTRLLVRKAELLLEKGCEVSALEFLDKAELLAPGELGIKILKIDVMIEQGLYNDALALVIASEGNAGKEALSELCFLKALIFKQKRKYLKMFQCLRKAIKANPNNQEALKKLWLAVELSGSFEESILLHTWLIDQNPYSAISWYNLGHAHFRLNDFCEAEQAFEYAFIIDKQFEDAYRECAATRIEMNDFERALDCYEDMLMLFKADAELFISIGYCYERMEKIDLALVCYEKSFKYSHINDWAYFRKGSCLLKRGQLNKAITCLEQANAIEKNKDLYMTVLAEAYLQNGQDEKANELYYQATGAAPDLCESWISYARFLLGKGKAEEALNLMNEAEIYAVGVELLYCKTACLFLTGHREDGFAVLRLALRQNAKLHYTLFDLCPSLKEDVDVIIAISSFKS